jgi:hypothetical protein
VVVGAVVGGVVVVVTGAVVVVGARVVVVVSCAQADAVGARTVRVATRNPRASTAEACLPAEGCMTAA